MTQRRRPWPWPWHKRRSRSRSRSRKIPDSLLSPESEPRLTASDDTKPTAQEAIPPITQLDLMEAVTNLTALLGGVLEELESLTGRVQSNKTIEPASSTRAAGCNPGAVKLGAIAAMPIEATPIRGSGGRYPECSHSGCQHPTACAEVTSCVWVAQPVPGAKAQARYHSSRGR